MPELDTSIHKTIMEIDEPERKVLLQELEALIASLGDSNSKARYVELRDAATAGSVSGHLVTDLEHLLVMSIQSGHVRRRESPQSEQILRRLFSRTPRGKIVNQSVTDTNKALAALREQTIDSCTVTTTAPGAYRMHFDTDRCQITLEFTQDLVTVSGVNIGI